MQLGGQTPLKLTRAARSRRRARFSGRRPTRSTSRRTASDSSRSRASWASSQPENGTATSVDEAVRCRDAHRLSGARAAVVRARRARDADRVRRAVAARLLRHGGARERGPAGADRLASSRTRSRPTSTRSPTARTSSSAASCSTSRTPASTPAIRRACCRRTSSPSRDIDDDEARTPWRWRRRSAWSG